MAFARGTAAGPDHGPGSLLDQGLLGTKAHWHLPLGVTQAPVLFWAARALLVLATLVFLAWAEALFAQVLAGQGAWPGPLIAMVLGVPWLAVILRLWRGLGQQVMVPVCWGGLPPSGRHAGAPALPPGWSVPGWPHAVSLHVVFDLGPWALVKMVSVGRGSAPEAWFWVNARLGLQGAAGHHLRALLFSSQANEVGLAQPGPADGSAVMASSTDIQRHWSNLLSSFKTTGQDVDKAASHQSVGGRGLVMAERDFAKTVILEFPPGHARRGARS